MVGDQPVAFLSFAHRGDATPEVVEVITDALQEHGMAVWIPEVHAGTDWGSSLKEALQKADFVIAEVTGVSPKVMMEVGMALGLGKKVLLLSRERSQDLPFDLKVHQIAVYKPNELFSVRKYLDYWLRDEVLAPA